MIKVSIYDFDHTIYNGDASVNFYLYAVLHRPWLLAYAPYQGWHLLLYIIGLHSRKAFKQRFFAFLKGINDTDALVEKFWQKQKKNLKAWYTEQDHANDVIISASPDFLLRPICDTLGVRKLIATKMDKETGEIDGENCRGKEKVRRFEAEVERAEVEETYSDSLSDMPIFKLAKRPYVVSKDRIIPLKEYKPSKLKKLFLKKNFLAFIIVGGFNTFTGILFAFIASLFIENGTLAFAAGYIFSLTISYFINSVITFNTREFSFKKYLKFCISYIPNFLVQIICVHLLIDFLGLYKLVAYTISAIIGIPITFAILSLFAFRKKEEKK